MGAPRKPSDDERINRHRESQRRNALKYRARYNENKRAWLKKHPEYVKQYAKKWRARLRQEMLDHYGRACACCGDTHELFLTLDHIDGGGRADSLEATGIWNLRGWPVYALLKRKGWPRDNYRILCMNCNWAIRFGGVCPHQGTVPC